METLFYYVLVPLVILGIAINIHEFGHFIVAKFFGMRVEAYSFFGLGPRVWGFKWGHTDYRLSAIPLGAYVKLYGDEATSPLEGGSSEEKVEAFLDERNIGKVDADKKPKFERVPDSELYELRPRWQKFFVMVGGPFMNIVLSLAIPFTMGLIYGIPSMPAPVIGSIKTNGAAEKAGIKPGDKIVAFNGTENPTWRNIEQNAMLLPEQNVSLVVEREGNRIPLEMTLGKAEFIGQNFGTLDANPDSGMRPIIVGSVEANTPAQEMGLQPRDRILAVNGETLRSQPQLLDLVQKYKAAPLTLKVERGGNTLDLTGSVRKLADGTERLGFGFAVNSMPLEPATVFSAFSNAVNTNLEILQTTGMALGQVFTGKRAARDTVSGPIGIFQQSAQVAKTLGWEGAIQMLMAISLSLGVFNLLPIPMLDGGQIMVLGIEKVLSWFGRTLSMAWRERIQLTGLAAILLLMVTVMFFDISKIVGK